MKVLIITEGIGYFQDVTGILKKISTITKDDLLFLITQTIELDDVEMDSYDLSPIANPAETIIYTNLHRKLTELRAQRDKILSQKKALYVDAKNKYMPD